jgi:hypothetical protein
MALPVKSAKYDSRMPIDATSECPNAVLREVRRGAANVAIELARVYQPVSSFPICLALFLTRRFADSLHPVQEATIMSQDQVKQLVEQRKPKGIDSVMSKREGNNGLAIRQHKVGAVQVSLG